MKPWHIWNKRVSRVFIELKHKRHIEGLFSCDISLALIWLSEEIELKMAPSSVQPLDIPIMYSTVAKTPIVEIQGK